MLMNHSNIAAALVSVTLLILSIHAAPSNAQASSASMQADLLLVKARKAMEMNDYIAAEKHLSEIGRLDVSKPAEYHFRLANVQLKAGKFTEAKKNATKYLSLEGRGGTYYVECLELIADLDVEEKKWQSKNRASQFAEVNSTLKSMGRKLSFNDSVIDRGFEDGKIVHYSNVTLSLSSGCVFKGYLRNYKVRTYTHSTWTGGGWRKSKVRKGEKDQERSAEVNISGQALTLKSSPAGIVFPSAVVKEISSDGFGNYEDKLKTFSLQVWKHRSTESANVGDLRSVVRTINDICSNSTG